MIESTSVSRKIISLALIPRNNHLKVWLWAKMASDFKQHNVIEIIGFLAPRMPQIAHLLRIGRIGEKTTASRRLRKIFNPKSCG
jgi:hypothetical protein